MAHVCEYFEGIHNWVLLTGWICAVEKESVMTSGLGVWLSGSVLGVLAKDA